MANLAAWILEQNDFSNSEFLCRSDDSRQVLAQSALRYLEMLFEDQLGYRNGTTLEVLSSGVSPCSAVGFHTLEVLSPGVSPCSAVGFHLLWHTVELAVSARLCLLW